VTSRRRRRTALGYRTFACHACRRVFNERTGTPFNDLQHPTDIVLLAVLWRLRYTWYLDETYVKVEGRWCYLYRAIDRDGALIDSMLSQHRDKHAARTFLRRLIEVAEQKPQRITTDQHPAYERAIRWIIGCRATHRTTQYLNNYTEQSHRAVKQRYYPMLGFENFESASRFCTAFDELRQYFRVRCRDDAHVLLAEQRRFFVTRWHSLIAEAAAA
jgi:transposase-like protein